MKISLILLYVYRNPSIKYTYCYVPLDPDALEDPPPPSSVAGIVQAGWMATYDIAAASDAMAAQRVARVRRLHPRQAKFQPAAGVVCVDANRRRHNSLDNPGLRRFPALHTGASVAPLRAEHAPAVVGETDRGRSIASSAPSAHDGISQPHRPRVHQTQQIMLIT